MSMGRRDFNAIAAVVSDAPYLTEAQRSALAKDLAREIKAINGNLNRERFLDACGVKEGALA